CPVLSCIFCFLKSCFGGVFRQKKPFRVFTAHWLRSLRLPAPGRWPLDDLRRGISADRSRRGPYMYSLEPVQASPDERVWFEGRRASYPIIESHSRKAVSALSE